MKQYIEALQFIETYTNKRFVVNQKHRLYDKLLREFINRNIEEATTKATKIELE